MILLSKIKIVIISFSVMVLLAGCETPITNSDIQDVQKTVLKFNYAMIDAYYNLDSSLLRESASEREFEKISILVSTYLEGSLVLESKLHELNFIDYTVIEEKDAIIVETSEMWSFRFVNLKGADPKPDFVKSNQDVFYRMDRRDDGQWIVGKTTFDINDIYNDKKVSVSTF